MRRAARRAGRREQLQAVGDETGIGVIGQSFGTNAARCCRTSLPSSDKKALRAPVEAERQALADRLERAVQLQRCCASGWSAGASARSAPTGRSRASSIRCRRCTAGARPSVGRRIGLPVIDRETGSLRFHVWYPGCPMEHDAYDIPKPKDTEEFEPALLLVPCLGFGPRRRAAGLRRRLLRPHAGVAAAAARRRSASATRTASCRGCGRAARRAAGRHADRRRRDVGG